MARKEKGESRSLYGDISSYRAEIYGAAILWIMLFHGYLVGVRFDSSHLLLHGVSRIIAFGNIGVECFLFLSGISLYFSFHGKGDLQRYIRRRAWRVYLPVWMIGGVYWVWMHFYQGLPMAQLVLALSGMEFWFDGNQEIWFVSLILLCYLLYPFVYAVLFSGDVSDRRIMIRTLTVMAVIMVILYCIHAAPGSRKTYKMVEIALTRIPVFILGCGCGRFVYERKKTAPFLIPCMAVVMLAAFYLLGLKILHGPLHRWAFMPAGVPLVFVLAAIMPWVPRGVRAALRLLGNMSLELYIMHLALKRLYERGLLLMAYEEGNTWKWLLILLISIPLCMLVRKAEQFLEKRIAERNSTES